MNTLRQLSSAIVLSLATASGPVLAQDGAAGVLELSPATSWNLDYAENSCGLSRTFGDGASAVLLELRQYAPGGPLSTTVASQRELRSRVEPAVYFGPTDDVRPVSTAVELDLADGYKGVRVQIYSGAPAAELSKLAQGDAARDTAEAALEWLQIEDVFADDIRLQTGPMQVPMAAMRECQLSLLEHWGFDPEEQRRLRQDASLRNSDRWVAIVLRRMPDREMLVTRRAFQYVLLFTGEDGGILDCRALSPNDDPDFAASFCDLAVARGSVDPAIDAAGDAVRSVLVHGLRTRTQAEPFYAEN